MPPNRSCPCCPAAKPKSRWRTLVAAVLPATCLALVPKCPLCVAAYVAMFTGVGVSLAVASTLRYAMIAVCFVWIVVIVARVLLRSTSANSCARTSS